jgi:pantoate--beta-alanine ligase
MREKDGLALSSRNAYLSAAERAIAPALYAAISEVAEKVAAGTPVAIATSQATQSLAAAGFTKIDYVEIRDAETLAAAASPGRPLRVLAAAWLGKTRLIDNVAV